MWAFGGWARPTCNILYPRWHHVRCGCVLCCAAYNIPVFAYLCALSLPFVPYHGVLVRGAGGCVALAGTDLFVAFPPLDPR